MTPRTCPSERARDPDVFVAEAAKWDRAGRDEARQAVIRALRDSGEPELVTRALRMAACSKQGHARIPRTNPGGARVVLERCGDRLCEPDHYHQTRTTRARLEFITKEERREGRRMRFVTLPLPRGYLQEGPRAAYIAINSAFLRFRRSKAWKQHVAGGFGGFENPWSPGTPDPETGKQRPRGWLPHWHCLVVGNYWRSACSYAYQRSQGPHPCPAWRYPSGRLGPKPWLRYEPSAPLRHCIGTLYRCDEDDEDGLCLSCAWFKVTGAYVVHIREAKPSDVVEVTKYITKPLSIPKEQIVRFALEMKGIHRFRWFGSWYGRKVPEEPSDSVTVWLPQLRAAVRDETPLVTLEGEVFGVDWCKVALAALGTDVDDLRTKARQRLFKRQVRAQYRAVRKAQA